MEFRLPESTQAIIFDLDGTLRTSEPGGDRFLLDHAASLGMRFSEKQIIATRQWAHQYWATSDLLREDIDTFGRNNATFWGNYTYRTLKKLGATEEEAAELTPKLRAHMDEHYQPEDLIPEDVYPTLEALKSAGLTLGLITNRGDAVDEYLVEKKLAEYLDFYFAAGEIGVWKPEPGIFFYGMGLAKSKPSNTLYIGDNYYADIVGARNAGMFPILIDREKIFPDADCATINEIGDLVGMLQVA